MSKERIRQWYSHWDGEVYVAFSGGLDSTVLLHLVRSMYPDVPGVFNNTGVEYPEIVKFIKGTDNIAFLAPKKRIQQVISQYGYPVVSKRVSQFIHEVKHSRGETYTKQLRLTGLGHNGQYHSQRCIPKKWMFLLNAPFKISHRCCYWLKKAPAKRAQKQFGYPLLGMRASESDQREQQYYRHGCNGFDIGRPRSWPLAFWTHADIKRYTIENNVRYCSLYDQGHESTGCFACMFGVHMEKEPNRFQRMKVTHPKLWTYCMDRLGLREVMEYINVPYE